MYHPSQLLVGCASVSLIKRTSLDQVKTRKRRATVQASMQYCTRTRIALLCSPQSTYRTVLYCIYVRSSPLDRQVHAIPLHPRLQHSTGFSVCVYVTSRAGPGEAQLSSAQGSSEQQQYVKRRLIAPLLNTVFHTTTTMLYPQEGMRANACLLNS